MTAGVNAAKAYFSLVQSLLQAWMTEEETVGKTCSDAFCFSSWSTDQNWTPQP